MSLKYAISAGIRHYRLAFFLYLFNISFGLFLGSQFYSIFRSGGADDWRHLGWGGQWDHALVQDFFSNQWNALEVIQFEIVMLIPIFIVINVFVTAGVYHAGRLEDVEWSDFWRGGSDLFWPFLVNFLLYCLLIALFTAVTVVPVAGWCMNYIENVGSEIGAFRVFVTVMTLFVLGLSFLVNASSASKAVIEKNKLGPIKALLAGLRIAMKKLFILTSYFFFFLLMAGALLFIVTTLTKWIGFNSWLMIIAVVILQQSFIFMRSLLRIMYLFSVQNMVVKMEE